MNPAFAIAITLLAVGAVMMSLVIAFGGWWWLLLFIGVPAVFFGLAGAAIEIARKGRKP